MKYPNKYCIGFCYWMLNTSWQTLTPSRLDLITTVYNAAIAGTSVTTLQYNNFTQITSWRLPFYEAFLKSELPYSAPPVGTCDFWLNPSGLVYNVSNSFGQVNNLGTIIKINDILGGAVIAEHAVDSKKPYILNLPSMFGQPNAIGTNTGAIQFFNLTNSLALVQNKTGYTLFCIANAVISGSSHEVFYFSSGTSGGAERIGIRFNTTATPVLAAKRLDADAQATLTGSGAASEFQIIAVTVNYTTGAGVIYQNGVATNTNAALVSTGSTSNTASVAAQIGALNGATPTNGLILDCLAFQTALSAADVLTITEWLNELRQIY